MPTYIIRTYYRGERLVQIDAANPDEAMDRYNKGHGVFVSDEVIEGSVEVDSIEEDVSFDDRSNVLQEEYWTEDDEGV